MAPFRKNLQVAVQKTLPLSLFIGIAGVMLLYIGANIGYLYQLDVEAIKENKPYDIIFIDPPYGKYELHQIVENLYEQSWADDESLIYLESNESLDKLVSPKYQLIRDSKAGNVYYGILK